MVPHDPNAMTIKQAANLVTHKAEQITKLKTRLIQKQSRLGEILIVLNAITAYLDKINNPNAMVQDYATEASIAGAIAVLNKQLQEVNDIIALLSNLKPLTLTPIPPITQPPGPQPTTLPETTQ